MIVYNETIFVINKNINWEFYLRRLNFFKNQRNQYFNIRLLKNGIVYNETIYIID